VLNGGGRGSLLADGVRKRTVGSNGKKREKKTEGVLPFGEKCDARISTP